VLIVKRLEYQIILNIGCVHICTSGKLGAFTFVPVVKMLILPLVTCINSSRSNRPHVIYIKLNGNTDIWLFFFPNATCLLEKQNYQFLQSMVWHIISYWKIILQLQLQSGYLVTSASRHLTKDYIYTRAQCLFLVAKARIPCVILSSRSAVLSDQIDIPFVYKPLAMINFRECFKVNF
jgi:hypothetical protein